MIEMVTAYKPSKISISLFIIGPFNSRKTRQVSLNPPSNQLWSIQVIESYCYARTFGGTMRCTEQFFKMAQFSRAIFQVLSAKTLPSRGCYQTQMRSHGMKSCGSNSNRPSFKFSIYKKCIHLKFSKQFNFKVDLHQWPNDISESSRAFIWVNQNSGGSNPGERPRGTGRPAFLGGLKD